MGWGVVEAPRRVGLVRVRARARSRRPVERASYEADWIRGRGGLPFIAVSVVLVFLLAMDVGTPVLLVPTPGKENLAADALSRIAHPYQLQAVSVVQPQWV
jgi:alpha-beta hydrolase superfamily lysophospholipase